MKKTKIKKLRKIGIVILITAVFVSLVTILTYADEEILDDEHDSYMQEYFDWVKGEFDEEGKPIKSSWYPENVNGSCAQVAASLLLSFYDSYWDDKIVCDEHEYFGFIDDTNREIWKKNHIKLENPDWKSYLETYWEEYKEENGENVTLTKEEKEIIEKGLYDIFLEEHGDEFLHTYLISLGKEKGYYEGHLDYGLSVYQLSELLTYYLSLRGVTSDQIEVRMLSAGLLTSREEVFQTAKNLIDRGFPVLYAGSSDIDQTDSNYTSLVGGEGKSNHILLGYKLINNESDIQLTPCWNRKPPQTFNTTEFSEDPIIIWLEIKDSYKHECSVSYKYSTYSEKEYCVCQIYSGHPDHECRIAETGEEPCPDNAISTNCLCGQVVGGHNYLREYSSDFHWYECSCGARTMSQAHTLVSAYDEEENIHYYTCYCGYREERHFFTYQDIGGGYHRGTCECGYTVTEIHTLVKKNPHYSTCMHCGYTKYTNGDIIEWPGILKRDDEEETE